MIKASRLRGFFILALRPKIATFIKPVYTLQRHQRLKSRKQIQWLFEKGQVRHEPQLRVVYAYCESNFTLQAGFSVSKKKFKRAVDRNRVKRLLREAWRLHSVPLRKKLEAEQKQLRVFLIFTGGELPSFVEIEEKIKNLIAFLCA